MAIVTQRHVWTVANCELLSRSTSSAPSKAPLFASLSDKDTCIPTLRVTQWTLSLPSPSQKNLRRSLMMPRNHKYQLTRNISQVMVSLTVSLHDGLYELSHTLAKPPLNLPSPYHLAVFSSFAGLSLSIVPCPNRFPLWSRSF